MAEPVPPLTVDLAWEGDLRFSGTAGDVRVALDSPPVAGPSPVQALAFGLAGCMAMDVVFILKKGRHDLQGLTARLTGRRAQTNPKRFVEIDLHFTVRGPVPSEAVTRAIELSRGSYCSVWHSLRQDITLTVTSEVVA